MYDFSLLVELLDQINEAIRRINHRFTIIKKPEDFVTSDDGLDRLDAIGMMLIAIGENIKRIDKLTDGKLLEKYPEIHWPGVKGVRDLLAHEYFNLDPEEIFSICDNDIKLLKHIINIIYSDLTK